MSADEAAAVVARLNTLGLAGGAYDTSPDSVAYPYVVVYMDSGPGYADREGDQSYRRAVGYQTTVVGETVRQARAALDLITGALEDWTPTVSGRSCTQTVHESSQPVRPDESLPDRIVHYATDQWSFVSDPA